MAAFTAKTLEPDPAAPDTASATLIVSAWTPNAYTGVGPLNAPLRVKIWNGSDWVVAPPS